MLREDLAGDSHRPQYHFLPPAQWLNDPNGVIYWKGVYHLFYQYNPHGPFHGTIHWGHAASQDLVHWSNLPIALTPTPDSVDEDGCWSGCAINNNGTPIFLYSGNQAGQQLPCLAMGSDDLVQWEKYARNPVIAVPPAELDVVGFRDHCVWQEGEIWYQLIGSGIKGVGGTALLYMSHNLIDWEYMHPLLVGDSSQQTPVWTGSMWECPQLLPLDNNKHILLISVSHQDQTQYAIWLSGSYINHIFIPEQQEMLDGGCFYAPQALVDEQDRRIMWGWLREGRSTEEQLAAGWSGVMSLPRLFSLRSNGVLSVQPVPELTVLRNTHTHYSDLDLSSFAPVLLSDIHADALELIATFEPGDAEAFGLMVRCSPDLREETRIEYNSQFKCITIDRSRASLNQAVEYNEQRTRCELAAHEGVTLHIFLDHSVVEIFVNERVCLSSRIYPTLRESVGVRLFASGGKARLVSLDVWELGAIW